MSLTDKQLNDAVSQHRQMCIAADAILMKMAAEEEVPPGSMNILRTIGLTESHDVRAQVNRCRGVLRHQANAGTKASRKKLQDQLNTAERALADRGPAIEQELKETVERLEGELEALRDAVREPAERLQAAADAIEHLRKDQILPDFIAEEAHMERMRAREFGGVQRAINSQRSAQQKLEQLKNLKLHRHCESGNSAGDENRHPNDDAWNLLYTEECLDFRPEAGDSEESRLCKYFIIPEKLEALKQRLTAESNAAQKVIDEGSEGFEQAAQDADELRNFYIK